MKYIYTANGCPACIDLKHAYDLQGVKYIERSAQRLKNPDSRRDQVDVDAFVQLSMQNMELPVEVNIEHFSDFLEDNVHFNNHKPDDADKEESLLAEKDLEEEGWDG